MDLFPCGVARQQDGVVRSECPVHHAKCEVHMREKRAKAEEAKKAEEVTDKPVPALEPRPDSRDYSTITDAKPIPSAIRRTTTEPPKT